MIRSGEKTEDELITAGVMDPRKKLGRPLGNAVLKRLERIKAAV